jgi:hypothetical protein
MVEVLYSWKGIDDFSSWILGYLKGAISGLGIKKNSYYSIFI